MDDQLKSAIIDLLSTIGELAITNQKFLSLYAPVMAGNAHKWDEACVINRILYHADRVNAGLGSPFKSCADAPITDKEAE